MYYKRWLQVDYHIIATMPHISRLKNFSILHVFVTAYIMYKQREYTIIVTYIITFYIPNSLYQAGTIYVHT